MPSFDTVISTIVAIILFYLGSLEKRMASKPNREDLVDLLNAQSKLYMQEIKLLEYKIESLEEKVDAMYGALVHFDTKEK